MLCLVPFFPPSSCLVVCETLRLTLPIAIIPILTPTTTHTMNGHTIPPQKRQLCAEESGEGGDAAELYEGDAAVCLRNGLDFEARSRRINATTEALVCSM